MQAPAWQALSGSSKAVRSLPRIFHIALGGLVAASWLYLLALAVTTGAVPLTRLLVALIATAMPTTLGTLISRRYPGHMIGRLFRVVAYAAATMVIGYALQLLNESRVLGYSPFVEHVTVIIGETAYFPIIFIPIVLMPLYFPTGKLLSRRWRPLVWLITFTLVWTVTAVALRPWPAPSIGITATRSWNGIPASEPLFAAMTPVLEVLALPVVPLVCLSVYLRYRRSSGVERTQMKWPIFTTACCAVLFLISILVPEVDRLNVQSGYLMSWTLAALFPLSLGVAILRHRLWDIDLVINRALVYGSLSALIIGTYVLIVSAFSAVFQSATSTVGGIVATGVVALLFQPLRERLQRGVNRLLYGERDDPAAVLTRLAQQVQSASAPAAVLPSLVETIAQTLRVPHAAIWLPVDGDDRAPVAVFGDPTARALGVPLVYRRQTIGELLVAPRNGQASFDRRDQELLAAIAALTATTVRAVQLSEEVSRSRRRIVTAREDERRRLRRDLHDGLGPQLASQALGLEAVAQLIPAHPEQAQALLEALKAQAEEATLDVRRLVYNLRPPALDDLGLPGALRHIAAHFESAELAIRLELPAVQHPLPAAVETAVYRIAQEAITNVVRHAAATHCLVRLACVDAYVVIEVRDNGRGLGRRFRSGVGMQAMRERTAELNGELMVEPVPGGGTLVRARLPLEVHDV